MKIRLPLVLLCLLAFQCAIAQEFEPGYIKLNQREQINGLVGKVIPGIPDVVEFKLDESAPVKRYEASEIVGYGFEGGGFFTSFLNSGPRATWAFVEILADGDLTLIRRNGLFFIYSRSESKIEFLDHHYIRTLRRFMKNCPIVAARRNVDLSKVELTQHVEAYNECVLTKKPNYDRLPPKRAIAVMAGYDNSSSSFVDNLNSDLNADSRFLTGGPLNDKSFVQIGVDVTLRNYLQSNNLGFFAGAYFNSNKYSQSNKITADATTEYNEYTIKFSQIKIPLGLEYMPITKSKLSFHVRGGVIFSNTFGLKSTHPLYYLESNSNGQIYSQPPAKLKSFDAQLLGMGALGFDYKINDKNRIRLQFGYSGGKVKAVVQNSSFKTTTKGNFKSFNVMAGFVF